MNDLRMKVARMRLKSDISAKVFVLRSGTVTPLIFTFAVRSSGSIWAWAREDPSSGICEQHRRRPACASAQSDQRLCCSLCEK